MSLLKLPRRGRKKADVSCRQVGRALVAHCPEGITASASRLASSLQGEPDSNFVVVDFPAAETSLRDWEAVAAAVAHDERAVRLFPAEGRGEITLPAAQWLADRIGRPVRFPDGVMMVGPAGLIFLPPSGSKGWTECTPGQPPSWQGRRFPIPQWEEVAGSSLRRLGRSTTVEPLPAGLWIRSDGPERWLDADRAKLTRWLSVSPGELTVVLGAHGVPPLPLTDVAQWWTSCPPAARAMVRFFCFGEFVDIGRAVPGQALANTLGGEVVCYGGFPTGRPDVPEVFSVREDGTHGVRTFAEQLAYRPRPGLAADAETLAPRVRRSRRPGESLTESEPGVYRHDSGAVVEVVQAGLWVRPPEVPAHAIEVRTTPVEPTALLVFHDPADEGLATRLLGRLEDKVRAAAKLMPLPAPPEASQSSLGSETDLTKPLTPLPRLSRLLHRLPAPAAAVVAPENAAICARLEPWDELDQEDGSALATRKIRHPDVRSAERQDKPAQRPEVTDDGSHARPDRQPTPDPELRAWPLPAGFSAELAMVRTGREAAFDALADRLGAGLRRSSSNRPAAGRVLTAAVATGLYLAGQDPDVDDGLRTGTAGPHVDFGRCVAEGLQKLPPHRKATATVFAPGSELWGLLEVGAVLHEWGFFHACKALGPVEGGSTDLVVWSLTGRVTTSVEPADGGVADRVVFLPGTAFRVLEVTEPSEESRGRILLRELAATEADRRGKSADRDNLVRDSLRAFAERGTRAAQLVPDHQASRFGRLPGFATLPTKELAR